MSLISRVGTAIANWVTHAGGDGKAKISPAVASRADGDEREIRNTNICIGLRFPYSMPNGVNLLIKGEAIEVAGNIVRVVR